MNATSAENTLDTFIWPQNITVRNRANEPVVSTVVYEVVTHKAECSIHLENEGKYIGQVSFYLVNNKSQEGRYIYIKHLQNTTISTHDGTREFSLVGTGLINLVKQIARKIGIFTIKLFAQASSDTPLPEKHDLHAFFTKMGFKQPSPMSSNYICTTMEQIIPLVFDPELQFFWKPLPGSFIA